MDDCTNQNAAIELYRPKRIVERSEDTSPIDVWYENSVFSFKDMAKLAKQVRKVQVRLDRRLEKENRGGLAKLGCSLWDEVVKATGGKAKNLDELYHRQQKFVKDLCGGLHSLQRLCQKHYFTLISFRKSSNERLSHIHALCPGIERRSRDIKEEYIRAAQQLSRLRKSDSTYYEMREKLARLRDVMNQAEHSVHLANESQSVIDRIALGVDSAARLRLHGKNNVDSLLERYSITYDYLDKALPSLNFTRNVMRNIKSLYDLNKAISESIRQAEKIEARIENPRLLANVQREVPALSGRSTADVLDYLNSAMQTSRDYVQNIRR